MSDPLWQIVDSGQLAGAATLVWKNGAAQTTCFGSRDIERKLPVEPDTIFRIASMTKPITSVAALMLVDEGRVGLDDPSARYAPEFGQMRVLRSPDGPLDETDAAERLITFEDLLTLDNAALQKVMREVDMRDLAVALKGSSPKLKEALLGCISKRAADTVKEEISFLGSVKKKDIEAAQQRVVDSVRRLESEGEIEMHRTPGAKPDEALV